MFFDGFGDLWRILVVGTAAYVALVTLLRLTGSRTLSKMSAFDLVITVAFGSTLASALLDDTVSLSEGVAAFALLTGLQYAVTYASVRSKRIADLVKAEPRLLLFEGRTIDHALLDERITYGEILAAIRAAGHGSTADIAAVVLETDGSMSVVARTHLGQKDALPNPPAAEAAGA